MKDRTTQLLLAAIAVLLLAHLVRPWASAPAVHAAAQAPEVIRAQAIELVDKDGKAVAQLFVGGDGGGNLRLRSGDGTVRVKLGATDTGSGLHLFDTVAEPAVSLLSNGAGTSVSLAERGKTTRVIRPD